MTNERTDKTSIGIRLRFDRCFYFLQLFIVKQASTTFLYSASFLRLLCSHSSHFHLKSFKVLLCLCYFPSNFAKTSILTFKTFFMSCFKLFCLIINNQFTTMLCFELQKKNPFLFCFSAHYNTIQTRVKNRRKSLQKKTINQKFTGHFKLSAETHHHRTCLTVV